MDDLEADFERLSASTEVKPLAVMAEDDETNNGDEENENPENVSTFLDIGIGGESCLPN